GLPAQPQSGKHGEENDPSPSATGVLCRGRPQRAPRGKSGQVEVFIELSPRNIASMWRISPSWILNASNTTEALLFGYSGGDVKLATATTIPRWTSTT